MERFRNLVAWIGEQIIYFLPLGSDYIGDKPYEEVANAEGLNLIRDSNEGGLIPDFDLLNCSAFDSSKIHPDVRAFYETGHHHFA